MNIIICDDDRGFIQRLDRKIRDYLNRNNISYKIKHCYSGEELLKLENNISEVDILFLDVMLNELNGIEIAAALRKNKNADFILIFISGFLEYAPHGYGVKATRYILKDQVNILFEEVMETILKEMGYFRSTLTLNFLNGEQNVFTDNIIYIESQLHKVVFHFTPNIEDTYIYDTLNSVEKLLPDSEFVRIHQSFVVNIRYLLSVTNYTATLINDIKLPISQKRFSEVKKTFFLYKGRI